MAKRVLYIHGIGLIGGAERDLLAMVQACNRDEWEPHVACPPHTPLSDRLAAEGIRRYPVSMAPWRKWYSPFVRWRDVRSLRALLAATVPDLVHVNDIWWVPHTITAVRGMSGPRPPIVAHVRQEIEPQKVRRYGLTSVEAVIAISKQVEQALRSGGVSPNAVRTIYSGVRFFERAPAAQSAAVYRAYGLPAGAVLLGTVAHVFARKGYDVMLRALPAIIREVPAVQYLIIGTGDAAYERQLKTLASALGVADHVHFAGFQEDVAPFLVALSLYVHPARMEGFGIAVAEALASGKAVVATHVGGVPEVVEHGQTGLLVPPDDPEQLSAAVLSLLRDEVRRKEMGERGARVARERFDLRASVAAVEGLYRQTLAAGRAPA